MLVSKVKIKNKINKSIILIKKIRKTKLRYFYLIFDIFQRCKIIQRLT